MKKYINSPEQYPSPKAEAYKLRLDRIGWDVDYLLRAIKLNYPEIGQPLVAETPIVTEPIAPIAPIPEITNAYIDQVIDLQQRRAIVDAQKAVDEAHYGLAA